MRKSTVVALLILASILPVEAASNECLIVRSAEGHRFRDAMIAGVLFGGIGLAAGAALGGAKYEYVDSFNLTVTKLKYKDGELKKLQEAGVHIVVVNKKATSDETQSARASCTGGAPTAPAAAVPVSTAAQTAPAQQPAQQPTVQPAVSQANNYQDQSRSLAISAAGQDASTGAIRGTVSDSAGSRIVDASIALVDEAQGFRYFVTSDAQGQFVFELLPPGEYSARAVAPDMSPQLSPKLHVDVGATTDIEFKLQVGGAKEMVTVAGEPPLVESQSNAVSSLVDKRAIEELPLDGRRFTDLALLTPGGT